MNEQAVSEMQTDYAPEQSNKPNGLRVVFWVALFASVAVGFAAAKIGQVATDKRWENMLVGSGLVTPEIAAKVRAECWTKRREFEKAATMRRWLQAENERVRRAPASALTAQPAAAPAPAPARATEPTNIQPKRDEP